MDRSLGVKIPSFFFNGLLIVQSFFLWGVGTAYMVIGVLLYHVLSNMYVGKEGLYKTGPFLLLSFCYGIYLISTSYLTNWVILFPSLCRYYLLCVVYLGVILFTVIHYADGRYGTTYLQKRIKEGIQHVMNNFNAESRLNNHLNAIQEKLSCCGTFNFTSWFHTNWAKGEEQVPPSCCKNTDFCHNLRPLVKTDIYTKGCFLPIDAFVLIFKVALFSTFLGTIAFQITGIMSGLIMALRYLRMHEMTAVVPLVPNN